MKNEKIISKFQERVKQLVKENRNAPADTIIRQIFKHFDYVRDDYDQHAFEDANECLEHWYNVDEMVLVFDNKGMERERRVDVCDHFIRLVHQASSDKPSVEDIVDYNMSLEKTPLANLLKEDHYRMIYR